MRLTVFKTSLSNISKSLFYAKNIQKIPKKGYVRFLGANHIYKKWKNKQLGAVTRKKNDYFVRRKAESHNPIYR
jgi:hypothetical protein